jgi:hypothetical protein
MKTEFKTEASSPRPRQKEMSLHETATPPRVVSYAGENERAAEAAEKRHNHMQYIALDAHNQYIESTHLKSYRGAHRQLSENLTNA